ncbi:hypothetical protein HK097_005979 [Rhizophlyctis rosea]|uniref:Uncharacterized protein n=1 Tax=Rhizophlyctis rosea TaxID=64517 RepID=A0AAD5SDR0_9FUNG|nr:hypothetical protein HK097_005979 [Rhizophlyctis rosea]
MAHEYDIDFDEIVHVDWARDGEICCPALTDEAIKAPTPLHHTPILIDGISQNGDTSFSLPPHHLTRRVVSGHSPYVHGTTSLSSSYATVEVSTPTTTPGTFAFEDSFRTSGCGVILADDLRATGPGLTKEVIRKFVAGITGNAHQLVPYNVLNQVKRDGVPRSCSSFIFLFLFDSLDAFEGTDWERITKSLGEEGLDGKVLPLFEGGLLPGGSPLLADVPPLTSLPSSTPVIHNTFTGRIFTPSEVVALATPLRPRSPLLFTRPEFEPAAKRSPQPALRSTSPKVSSTFTKLRAKLQTATQHKVFTTAFRSSIASMWAAIKKEGIWDASVSPFRKTQKKQPVVAERQLERIALWEVTVTTLSLFFLGYLLCTVGSLIGAAVTSFGHKHKHTLVNNATAAMAIPTTTYTSVVVATQTTLATVTKTQWELATKIIETTPEPKPVVHIDGNGRPVTEIGSRQRANPSAQLGRIVSIGLGRALGKTSTAMPAPKEANAGGMSKKDDKRNATITKRPSTTYIAAPPLEMSGDSRSNTTSVTPFLMFDYSSLALKVLHGVNATAALVAHQSDILATEFVERFKRGAIVFRKKYDSILASLQMYLADARDWIFGVGDAGQGRRWAQGSPAQMKDDLKTAAKEPVNTDMEDGNVTLEKRGRAEKFMKRMKHFGGRQSSSSSFRQKWEDFKKRAGEVGEKGQIYTDRVRAGNWIWA